MKLFPLITLATCAALALPGCQSEFVRWASDPDYYRHKRAEAADHGIYYDRHGQVRALVIAGQVYTATPSAVDAYDDADDEGAAPVRGHYGMPAMMPSPSEVGTPVYHAEDCIGPVVAGVCHGAVAPSAQAVNPQRCYGQMLNGQCTGPSF